MSEFVQAADLIRYNANERGNNVGDCVKRSMSLALNISYNEVSKELNAMSKSMGGIAWNRTFVFEKVLKKFGVGNEIYVKYAKDRQTLGDMADGQFAQGIYLASTGPTSDGRSNHLVCVIDGKVYDSWDSRDQYVMGYWVVKGQKSDRVFTDIKDHLSEVQKRGEEISKELVDKYTTKYGFKYNGVSIGSYISNFAIYFELEINVYDSADKRHYFEIETPVVFTPNTTVDEAYAKLDKTLKVRMYDRFYEVKKRMDKEEEKIKYAQEYGNSNLKSKSDLWLTPQASRFYDSLPGWFQPLITSIRIDRPGQYSDSYTVMANPLPSDSRSSRIRFEGYEADTIRKEIELYKKEGQRPFDDYDPTEMF